MVCFGLTTATFAQVEDIFYLVMLVYTIVGGGLIFMMPAADSVGVFIAFTLLYGPCGGVCASPSSACLDGGLSCTICSSAIFVHHKHWLLHKQQRRVRVSVLSSSRLIMRAQRNHMPQITFRSWLCAVWHWRTHWPTN